MDHIRTGIEGERIATNFLRRKGFTIVEQNYSRSCGEVDIVARKGGTVHFVEVKTISRKTSEGAGGGPVYRPEEQAHDAKLHKVARTAELYVCEKGSDDDYQIDVVAIVLDLESKTATCRLFEAVL